MTKPIDVEGTELPTPQKPRFTDLLTIHIHEGRIVAIGDSYGTVVNIAAATRTGFGSKRLAAKPKPAQLSAKSRKVRKS